MGWEALIPIIAQYGLPLAASLFEKWAKGTPPTAEDFAELRTLASQSARDRLRLRLVALGIPLDSPKAEELLKLV